MIVRLPKSATHSRVEVIVEHTPTRFRSRTIADNRAMSQVEIETPEGVDVSELDVTARFCNARGQHAEGMGVEVIQTAQAPSDTIANDPQIAIHVIGGSEAGEAGEAEVKQAEDAEAREASEEPGDGSKEPTDDELEAMTQPASNPFYPNGDGPK